MDRAEAVKAERTDLVIRRICNLGGVPWMADGFIVHRISPAVVTQTLCDAIRRDPDSGRVAALQSLAFLAPEESATTWDAQDRRWLREMERAFADGRGGLRVLPGG